MRDGRIFLKTRRDVSFNKVLSNEPTFGRIHLVYIHFFLILKKTRLSRQQQFSFFAGIREDFEVLKGTGSRDKYFLNVYKIESVFLCPHALLFLKIFRLPGHREK
jgi:hypothetical protein